MRIDALSDRPDRAGRHLLTFSDGSTMRLYRQTIEDFGLYTGLELEKEQLAALRTAAGQMSAKMRAVRIVAASNVSKKDLQQRLVRKGESEIQAAEAVRWMEELNLVDDLATARQIVDRCIRQGYGLSRAKQALYEKQIPKKYWAEVLEDYPDQTEAIQAFIQSRLGTSRDSKELRRVTDALVRRGHSYSQIRSALNALDLDSDQFPEEF
jgi:regulatory protein